jgi:hypothetical protein
VDTMFCSSSMVTDLTDLLVAQHFAKCPMFEHLKHFIPFAGQLSLECKDTNLSVKMQLDPDLTLEKATDMARQSESVRKQQSSLDEMTVKCFLHFCVLLFVFII